MGQTASAANSVPAEGGGSGAPVNTNPITQLEIGAITVQLQSLNSRVKNSINDLVQIKTTESTDLQANYSTILSSIRTTLATANSTDPTSLASTLQALQSEVRTYDGTRDTLIRAYTAANTNFFSGVWNEFQYYCMMFIYVAGPLFAAIISANVFFKETFLLKLFYIFWGTLWYPLTLLYGCINPPVWRSIMPLVSSDQPAFFEFWKYENIIDLDVQEKTKLMLRLICMGLLAVFFYVFFIVSA